MLRRTRTLRRGAPVSTLDVWRYDTPDGADDAVATFTDLVRQERPATRSRV